MLERDGPPHQPSAADAALLTLADPNLNSRTGLVGPNTLELFCALLQRGSTNVSAMRVNDKPPAGTADMTVIPHIASPDGLVRAVAHARRILAPLGTVAIHLAAPPADALSQQAGRFLLLHGFTAIRMLAFPGDPLMRAELPLHGGLACA